MVDGLQARVRGLDRDQGGQRRQVASRQILEGSAMRPATSRSRADPRVRLDRRSEGPAGADAADGPLRYIRSTTRSSRSTTRTCARRSRRRSTGGAAQGVRRAAGGRHPDALDPAGPSGFEEAGGDAARASTSSPSRGGHRPGRGVHEEGRLRERQVRRRRDVPRWLGQLARRPADRPGRGGQFAKLGFKLDNEGYVVRDAMYTKYCNVPNQHADLPQRGCRRTSPTRCRCSCRRSTAPPSSPWATRTWPS